MSDFLSEKEWEAELKAHKIAKDGGLKDALVEWAKVKGKPPDAELEALEGVIDAAAAAQKLLKAQKDLAKFAAAAEIKAQAELARIEKEAGDGGEDGAVDKELYTALKRAKNSPMYAAIVAKGSTDGKLLMAKMKVKPPEIAAAKKEVGGETVYLAATLFEDGAYVFELKREPPPTLARLIKKLAKEQAGLLIRVVCRAGTNLDDLEEAAAAAADVGPPQVPPAKQPAGGPAEEYHKLLALLTPSAKQAITEKRVDTALVAGLLQSAQGAATAGDFAKGLQELHALQEALDGATAQGDEPAADKEKEAFEARLKTVGADLLIHLHANPDDRADLTELLHDAQNAGGVEDFESGHGLLDRIDRIIIAGKKAARGAEMAEQIPAGAASSGLVQADQIDAALAAWLVAREAAANGAAVLAEQLRSSEYEELHPIASLVDELVDGFPTGLDSALDDLRSATLQRDTPQIKQLQLQSKTEIKACLEYLHANDNLISACEQHPLGGNPVEIAEPLKHSLRTILELVK